MENLKAYLSKKGMFPRVDFDDKKVHTFEVLKGKEIPYEDGTSSYKMLVKESNEYKVMSTPSVLLEIRDCQPGDIYEVQLKYRNIGGKTPIRVYEVKKIKSGRPTEEVEKVPDIKEEIPVIEDEGTPPTKEELAEIFPEKDQN